ncbi:MAG: DUF2194 domain-containing protein [Eubacteriales bacterium]|nr:DUF2194 domain-containing protein [Eubacteriales bacterium]MDD4476055.1 DUF2194 domain-containing protein [Eubacteriales bacterium]
MDDVMGKKISLGRVVYPLILLTVIAAFLMIERNGMEVKVEGFILDYLPQEYRERAENKPELKKECLIITSDKDEYSEIFLKQIKFVLDSASVGYDVRDYSKDGIVGLDKYQTVVNVIGDTSIYGTDVFALTDWVEDGGRVFFLNPLTPSPELNVISNWIGIDEGANSYVMAKNINILTDFMIGSKDFVFDWEDDMPILNIGLVSNARTHVTTGEGTPVLWEREYGKGRFVVNTWPVANKATRGYTLAAYSLLQDVFAYPVINASTFFIDDFPAPVPDGYNEYVLRDYNRTIESFYRNIWWPDMLRLSRKYNLKYTGLIIEQYTDITKPPFDRYGDLTNFKYFGNMLLNNGGQLGYHGYNHQPIVFENFDYMGLVDYQPWPSYQAARDSFGELVNFADILYPNYKYEVYVAPSNILSDEGLKLLVDEFPHINVVCGTYTKTNYEYEQEFCIDKYGKINVPRIVYGTTFDSYSKWLLMNELNFHFINTYFIHPDDALDIDRGADKGWKTMYKNLEDYIKWLQQTAPSLRNLSSSDTAKAVERYDTIWTERTLEEKKYTIKTGNYYDQAFYIIRLRGSDSYSVKGGALTHIAGELYLVNATDNIVEITFKN